MLKATFLHLPKYSNKKESELWRKGILSWEDFLDQSRKTLLPSLLSTPLDASITAYEKNDIAFFSKVLPKSEYFRIALTYPQDVLFLDIETTGLSLHYNAITVVGWSYKNEYKVYISGEDPQPLYDDLADAKVVVTFNGTLFDLKFIRKRFEQITIPEIHVDLRFLCKRVGLVGGQKKIEQEIGVSREDEVSKIDGEAAPLLWAQYRRGDKDALKRLIAYNFADIEGMHGVFDAAIKKLFEKNKYPKKVAKIYSYYGKMKPLKLTTSAMKKGILIRDFIGNTGPLITYSDLNNLSSLDTFSILGIDLVSSEKKGSGVALLQGNVATTCRMFTDEEMIQYAIENEVKLVSIDSPLSIPEERTTCWDDDPTRYTATHAIMRYCERILKKRGINSYPCLINSMQKLTDRGMRLAGLFREKGIPVIESYPGAAQDILHMPRKQAGLDFLVRSLEEFGLQGGFIKEIPSHDEIDAITCAIVGQFFWTGKFEALGNDAEDYLIIPDLEVNPSIWLQRKVFGLSGKSYTGKSTLKEYFENEGWASRRYSDVLRSILAEDAIEETKSNLQDLGLKVHKEKGQRWLGRKLLENLEGIDNLAIDGLRYPEDHAYLVERFGPAYQHVFVDSPQKLRETRYPTDTQYSFEKMETHAVEGKIELLEKLAHTKIYNDFSSAQDFLAAVKSKLM